MSFAVGIGAALVLCLSQAKGGPDALRYEVEVDEAMAKMTVRLCFEGAAPPRLVAGSEDVQPYLKQAVLLAGGKERRLAISEDGVDLPKDTGRDACVRLQIDLDAAKETYDRDVARPVGGSLVLSPDLFFWQPKDVDAKTEITASFRLPPGFAVTTPWTPIAPDRFRVERSAFEWQAMMTLGRFRPEALHAGGATLTVARLDRPTRATPEGVRNWLERAAGAVTLAYGRFPADRVQVIVEPVRGDGCEFGYVMRGGGSSTLFLLGDEAEDDDLLGEWVAVHEFSHLILPFVAREDAWLSEGLATYYQEVLRARAGLRTPLHAWQQLHEGFERGHHQRTRYSLAETTARMHLEYKFMRVYWSGAAIVLLADVMLRSMPGDKSLDRVLLGLRGCCLHDQRQYSAREVFAILDRESGTHVFGDLYDRYAPSKDFPDLRLVYQRLGLVVDGEKIRLDDRAPLARVRNAIMSPARR